MTDRLTTIALNEVRAVQREIQGIKNLQAAMERRLRTVEARLELAELHDLRGVTADDVAAAQPAVEYPRHVPGTSGRGIQYELSDGTVLNAGKAKAVAAEAKLHSAPV